MRSCPLVLVLALGVPALAQEAGPPPALGVLACEATQVRYELTPADAVWSARMLTGEAGGRDDPDSAAVLWAMLNSYALRPVRTRYPSFAAFVRAYCTPLQPWLKSEGALRRHQKRGTPLEEVEPGRWQLVRHLKLQRRPWSELPAGARAVVTRVLGGELPSVCGNATQFCSTAIYYRDRHDRRPDREEHAAFTREFAAGKNWRWQEVAGSDPLKNVFFVEERFAQLPAPAVQVLAPQAPPALDRPKEALRSLTWLAGHWRQDTDEGSFQAQYTTPAGGIILSASKQLRGERAVFFEFERFAVEQGAVVLQPYPGGQAAASFRLVELHPRSASFANPKNAFPQRITYARVAEDRLTITLEAQGRPPVRFELTRLE